MDHPSGRSNRIPLRLLGIEPAERLLRWRFQATLPDRGTFTVTALSSRTQPIVHDLQTSDGQLGTTGSPNLDAAIRERIRLKLFGAHAFDLLRSGARTT